jgi:butyryl-CoA dehydrogenase
LDKVTKSPFNILNLGRLKLGTRNIGSAKQALTRAVRYAVERRQFGRAIAEFGLIKQKLAEMTVRCYIGDAMVYRTLGDVDRALEAIDQLDHDRVLKAIEGYAVECSINKVWTSEALATVVDESLQVFGGYGYSQEFPAERAYRDARITRIYEGTNEINRLIITLDYCAIECGPC